MRRAGAPESLGTCRPTDEPLSRSFSTDREYPHPAGPCGAGSGVGGSGPVSVPRPAGSGLCVAYVAPVTGPEAREGDLDSASSAPLHPAARDVLLAALERGYADPRRLHRPGRE